MNYSTSRNGIDYDSRYLVGAYERLSREDNQTDESSSIESQRMIINSFATFNKLRIVKHYADDGFTGSNFDRPSFEELKRDIEEGIINCVIVKDLSRLGREMYETGAYIEEYFLSKNVRFIAINDGYDSVVGDSMLGIRLSVNDLYLRDTSKKIRSSFDAKRKNGDYIGSFAKYGYMKNPNNPKQLIPDPAVASNVVQMFEWAADGLGTSAIAHKLTEHGYLIPAIYKKENRPTMNQLEMNDGRGIWRSQTVKSILEDQLYLGHMVQGKWKKLSYNSKRLIMMPENQWFVVKNTHEPLITQELYDKAQETLKRCRKFAAKKDKRFLLQGLMFCKDCGHAMTISERKTKTGISRFGMCNYYIKYSKYGYCTAHRFNYNVLEQDILMLLHRIGELLLKELDGDKLIKQSMSMKTNEIQQIDKKLKQIDEEMKKIQTIVTRMYDDRLNDIISARQYSLMGQKYDTEIERLNKNKEELLSQKNQVQNNELFHDYEKCKQLMEEFMEFEKPSIALLNQIIDRIDIDESLNVDITFKVNIERYLSLLELNEKVSK